MEIIFLLPDLPLSGAATRTVHLARQLRREGHQILVALLRRNPNELLRRELNDAGIETVFLFSARHAAKVVKVLARRNVVIHAAVPTAGLAGLVLAGLARDSLIYSYTNCLHAQRPFKSISLLDGLKQCLERVLATSSSGLHAVSQSVGAQVRSSYPIAELPLLAAAYTGTPALESLPATSQELPAQTDFPRLLSLGRLLPHKRHEDVINAAAVLRQEWPQLKLLIVGSGPHHCRLTKLASDLGLSEQVRLIGETTSPASYLRWANLLVHPSLFEGFPRVFAEASVIGLPIVSVDTPYAREFAMRSEPIRLARPFDSLSLANAITQALRDNHPTASGEIEPDRHAAFAAFYESLLAGNGSSPQGKILRRIMQKL